MSKAGSEVILKCLMGKADEIDVDALPMGEDEKVPAGIETVVVAETVRPARGRVLEEVMIKREAGGVQRVVLDLVGDRLEHGAGSKDEVVVVKEEPVE